jgi:hypothetical protein
MLGTASDSACPTSPFKLVEPKISLRVTTANARQVYPGILTKWLHRRSCQSCANSAEGLPQSGDAEERVILPYPDRATAMVASCPSACGPGACRLAAFGTLGHPAPNVLFAVFFSNAVVPLKLAHAHRGRVRHRISRRRSL